MTTAPIGEPTAPLDQRERQRLAEQQTWQFQILLLMDAAIVAILIVVAIKSPESLVWWHWFCVAAVALLMALLSLSAWAERSSLREDLARGVKALRDGVIDAKRKREDEESAKPTYRIYIVIGDREEPIDFIVPQALYDSVEEDQAVRIGYAPASLFLFELSCDRCRYIAVDDKITLIAAATTQADGVFAVSMRTGANTTPGL